MKACVERKPYTIPLPARLIGFLRGKSARTVLEIGCGYGRTCFFLQKNGLDVAGIDLDRVQVRLASEEMKRQNIRQGINLVVNDARNLCFPDDSFDVVTMLGVLTLVPKAERPGIMNEAERVLKPSGYVFVEEFGRTWENRSTGRDTESMSRSPVSWARLRSETRLEGSFILAITSPVKRFTVS